MIISNKYFLLFLAKSLFFLHHIKATTSVKDYNICVTLKTVFYKIYSNFKYLSMPIHHEKNLSIGCMIVVYI